MQPAIIFYMAEVLNYMMFTLFVQSFKNIVGSIFVDLTHFIPRSWSTVLFNLIRMLLTGYDLSLIH